MGYKMLNGFQKWSQSIEGKEGRLRRTGIKVDWRVIFFLSHGLRWFVFRKIAPMHGARCFSDSSLYFFSCKSSLKYIPKWIQEAKKLVTGILYMEFFDWGRDKDP